MSFTSGGAVCAAALTVVSCALAQMRMPVAPPEKTITNSPYTSEGVNEMVQTLADGTKITRKNTVRLARDSQGRTRLETHFEQIGAWSTGKTPRETTVISDPVANQIWQVDPKARTATALPMKRSQDGPRGLTDSHAPFALGGDSNTKVENLGQRAISGVLAEGTRLTHVIAAGEDGNDKPITIVNERWYSPELQTVVLSTQSDPRMGVARFQLTSIDRSEPAASLFQVPPDYSIKPAR